jgi:hypothetical protein
VLSNSPTAQENANGRGNSEKEAVKAPKKSSTAWGAELREMDGEPEGRRVRCGLLTCKPAHM